MRLPSFKSLKTGNSRSVPNDEIFADAIELAQLRLEQCIADLNDRIRTPKQALERGVQSPSAEIPEPAV
jgi:hypothetical protein